MKRQYRYKTATNTNFFPNNLFNELDDSLKTMNEEIIKKLSDSRLVRAWKSLINHEEKIDLDGRAMASAIDGFIFKNRCDAELMGMVQRYEEWYRKSYDFLNKDDYKEINKSIDDVDTIAATASTWGDSAGENNKKVHELLDMMRANASAVEAGNTSDVKIDTFLSVALSDAAFSNSVGDLIDKMNAIVTVIDNPNANYMAGIGNPLNVINVKASSVMAELVQMQSAHAEENRTKRKKVDVYDDAKIIRIVNRALDTFETDCEKCGGSLAGSAAFNNTISNYNSITSGTAGPIPHIPDASSWYGAVSSEITDLYNGVEARLHDVRSLINNGTLLGNIANIPGQINAFFDETSHPILSGEAFIGVSDQKKFALEKIECPEVRDVGTLGQFKQKIVEIFKDLNDDLKDHV